MNEAMLETSRAPSEQVDARCVGDAPSASPAGAVASAGAAGAGWLATPKEMIAELVEHRELLWQMMLRNIRIRYKQALMGFGWAIFMPLMIVGAGIVIKFVMAQSGGGHFRLTGFAGMAVKAVPWSFFVGTLGFATTSLTGNLALMTKIYFPREVFPFSYVLTQAFDSSVGAIVLIGVLLALGVTVSLHFLWVVPLALLLLLFAAGASLLLSCGNLFFRDVKYLVQVIVMFGIFFTPVFYDAANLGPVGAKLVMLNPLAPLLEGLRLSVVAHHNLLGTLTAVSPGGEVVVVWQPWYLLYSAIWSLLGFFGAWSLFHKLEFVYAEYV